MESIFDLFILDNVNNCLSSVSHNSFMAQLVEWWTFVLMVWGSNPMAAQCFSSFLRVFLCFGSKNHKLCVFAKFCEVGLVMGEI